MRVHTNTENGEFNTPELNADLVRAIREHRDQALAYAAYIQQRKALPPEERKREKDARASFYRIPEMAGLFVTQKQLDYLRVLGYRGPAPKNRAEASRLIGSLKEVA